MPLSSVILYFWNNSSPFGLRHSFFLWFKMHLHQLLLSCLSEGQSFLGPTYSFSQTASHWMHFWTPTRRWALAEHWGFGSDLDMVLTVASNEPITQHESELQLGMGGNRILDPFCTPTPYDNDWKNVNESLSPKVYSPLSWNSYQSTTRVASVASCFSTSPWNISGII